MNFCPTPSIIDKFQLKKDIDEFQRRLKLKYCFDKVRESIVSDKNRRFKDKSKWEPEINDPMLDLFLNNLELELFSIKVLRNMYFVSMLLIRE